MQKDINHYLFFFYIKGKIVILQILLFKIIYNILTTITSLTNFNKKFSHIYSNIPQSKQPQLSSHFLHTSTPTHPQLSTPPHPLIQTHLKSLRSIETK